jgi:hypothetical protein
VHESVVFNTPEVFPALHSRLGFVQP